MTEAESTTRDSSATRPTDGERRRAGWVLTGTSVFLTVVIVIWYLREPSTFFSERLGMNTQAGQIGWAWLLALLVTAVYTFYTVRGVSMVNEHKFEMSRLKLIGVWAALSSGVVEEVVFRQIVMDAVAARGGSAVLQVVLSAALFGLAHGLWGLLGGEWRIAVPAMAATAFLGAALAVVYLVADRNVLPAIVAHTAINLVIEPWLILAAVSRRFLSGKGAEGDGTA